jgi:GNAT superfamily N-acetyltransferase
MRGDDLRVRRATESDRHDVVELCRASLGWTNGDVDEEFFSWKHDLNPAGPSPAWVAEASDGRLTGVRVFLRWRFRDPAGRELSAVRAVDTATHPDWQGKGIFKRLTLGALPDLRADGVDFVFNTPNEQSRPGYLKMGWNQVGRLPVGVRVASLARTRSLAGARTAAEKWSQPTTAGVEAAKVLSDAGAVEELLGRLAPSGRIHTHRTPAHLLWRYRFEPLHYRAMLVGDDLADGAVVFRVRRRGTAVEGTICEVLLPPGTPGPGRIFGRILEESGADYLIRSGGGPPSHRFLPAPKLGPILTWKPLERIGAPRLADLDLALGDIELF